ncbi:Glu-tRNA(Gln) amidotransferase GatDE subunit E, partial [candidate division WOR-3 bacterium]|nr:Glu-tRNA(Gln) amidotransferase GatDE subunit E [candidate division WOR-3 bacterium]
IAYGKETLSALALKLPGFDGILSFFMSPGKEFADELSTRLKVIAGLEKPNLMHTEDFYLKENKKLLEELERSLKTEKKDSILVLWGPHEDIETARDVIEERCMLLFDGVPGETRKGLLDGTTIFERVLPGPDRMYPDTDSAPIPIENSYIEKIENSLPISIEDRFSQMKSWDIPDDVNVYLMKKNLLPVLEELHTNFEIDQKFLSCLFGHYIKNLEGRYKKNFPYTKLPVVFQYMKSQSIVFEKIKDVSKILIENPNMEPESLFSTAGFVKKDKKEIIAMIPELKKNFSKIRKSKNDGAEKRWLMGRLKDLSTGNIPLKELEAEID